MTTKRSKPKKKNGHKKANTIQVTFRIEKPWLLRADKVAEKLSSNGVRLTRTDGFRAVMAAGFDALED